MRTARDEPGNYGRRFSGTRMVYDVAEQEEREDDYIITLTFRPEGDFAGTPGQEQFYLEKEGSVTVRQIRSLPVTQEGEGHFPWTPVAIVATLVGVIGALAGVLFAAGVIPPSSGGDPEPTAVIATTGQVTVALVPDRPARLASPSGDVTVDLSAGSVDRRMELVYQGLSPEEIPPLPAGFNASEKLFDLSVAGSQAPTAGRFFFTRPATITVRLDPDHARQAGREESNLVIQHFHKAQGEWTPLPTTVDFNAATARAQVDSLSIFALTIKEPRPTDTSTPTDTPTPVVVSFQLTVNGRPVTGASIATTNATVSVSPPPNAANNRYISGTEVSLTLSPASGFTGSCDTLAVTMTSDRDVGCTMTQHSYVLSIEGQQVTGPSLTTVEGTVSLSPAPNASGNRYSHGTVVNLNLTPASGFSGFCDTLAVTMTSDRDVSCTIIRQRYVLTIEGVPVRAGQTTVEVANGEIDLSEAPGFDGRYASNVEVSLFAFPYSEGATIIWGGTDTADLDFATVQMDRDRFITVDFVPPPPTPTPLVLDLHGDSIDTATSIFPGRTSGAINPANDLDFFGFFAEAGTTYTIEVLLDTHPDTVLKLYDSRGNFLEENDDAEGLGNGSRIEWTAPSTGEYYVEVYSFDQSSKRGFYNLSLSSFVPEPPVTPISLGLTTGSIDTPGELDEFLFSAEAGTTYTIEVLLDTHPNTVLTLYDSLGNFLEENDDAEGLGNGSRIQWTAPAAGDYYLAVRSFDRDAHTGSYQLYLEATSLPAALSGFYVGSETSDTDGSTAPWEMDIQETDGTVTGYVDVFPPHIGDSDILNGFFSGNNLSFDTAYSNRGDQYRCSYFGQRQPDQQTLIGEYDCFVVGSTFTDTGS